MTHSRIYLVGFMGAGKSTIGRRVAKKLGWTFIDLDEQIERREGRTIAEMFRAHGEPYFRNLENLCLQDSRPPPGRSSLWAAELSSPLKIVKSLK